MEELKRPSLSVLAFQCRHLWQPRTRTRTTVTSLSTCKLLTLAQLLAFRREVLYRRVIYFQFRTQEALIVVTQADNHPLPPLAFCAGVCSSARVPL